MKTKIQNSNLPARAINALTRGGFVYFEDLAAYSRFDLMSLRNMTAEAMSAIDAELSRLAITLSDVDRGLPEVHSTLKDKACFAESFDTAIAAALVGADLYDLDSLQAFLAPCPTAEERAAKLQQSLHLTPEQSQKVLDTIAAVEAFEPEDEARAPFAR